MSAELVGAEPPQDVQAVAFRCGTCVLSQGVVDCALPLTRAPQNCEGPVGYTVTEIVARPGGSALTDATGQRCPTYQEPNNGHVNFNSKYA
ncbi:MAG TPA: hypothetical protein VLI54_04725 [Bacillota bacterium]|nr:hypothetical protein [Bacillota bacterium]